MIGSGRIGVPGDLAAEWTATATAVPDGDTSGGEDEAGSPSFGELLGGALVAAATAPGAPASADSSATMRATEGLAARDRLTRCGPESGQRALAEPMGSAVTIGLSIEVQVEPGTAEGTLPSPSLPIRTPSPAPVPIEIPTPSRSPDASAIPTSVPTSMAAPHASALPTSVPTSDAGAIPSSNPASAPAPMPARIPAAVVLPIPALEPSPSASASPNQGLIEAQIPEMADPAAPPTRAAAPSSRFIAPLAPPAAAIAPVTPVSAGNIPIELRVGPVEPAAPPGQAPAELDRGAGDPAELPPPHSTLLHPTQASTTVTSPAVTSPDPAPFRDAPADRQAAAPGEDPAQPSPSRELGHSSARITLGDGDSRVAVWIAVRGDSVRVDARAHSAAYADVLNQRADELAAGLAERGLVLGSMSADVAGGRAGHHQTPAPDDRADRRRQPDADVPQDPDPTQLRPRGVRVIA